jgi:uncharacterized protein YegP (UPF0339 family)
MSEPVVPYWFRMRQGEAEAAAPNTLRLTAPNQGESFISIERQENGQYAAILRAGAEGPEIARSIELYGSEDDAWGAAFELYRTQVVV